MVSFESGFLNDFDHADRQRRLINLVTAGGLINYIVMCTTYIFFYRACKAQEFDRSEFPYFGYFQPYCVSNRTAFALRYRLMGLQAYIGLVWMTLTLIFYGYSSFRPWYLPPHTYTSISNLTCDSGPCPTSSYTTLWSS
jgi:amino acid permease